MDITISQRLVAAVALLVVMVAGVALGATIDATAWAEAWGVIFAVIVAVTAHPPGQGSGDWGALLRDTKFQGALVTVIVIAASRLGWELDPALVTTLVATAITLLLGYAARQVHAAWKEE